MIDEKSNRAEQVKGGRVLPAQARKGGGSMVAESEPRPLLRVQGAKVALAKVSTASRKVRVQPHFVSSTSKLKMGRGKRAGHWRAVVLSKLHIDDGSGDWSGGTEIPHDSSLSGVERDNIYKNYFLQGDNNHPRRYIFHYAIFGHEIDEGVGGIGGGTTFTGEFFTISDGYYLVHKHQENMFLHELGHCLGLSDSSDSRSVQYDGIDNIDTVPRGPSYNDKLYSNYKSVMNYHYTYEIAYYSDGSHGYDEKGHPDHDDWGNLMFDYFLWGKDL